MPIVAPEVQFFTSFFWPLSCAVVAVEQFEAVQTSEVAGGEETSRSINQGQSELGVGEHCCWLSCANMLLMEGRSQKTELR